MTTPASTPKPTPTPAAPVDKRTTTELQDELRARDLPTSGTREEMVVRLDNADAAAADTKAAKAADAAKAKAAANADTEAAADAPAAKDTPVEKAGLVTETGTVNTAAVATFAGDARTLIDEIRDRLERELIEVLADFETRNTAGAGRTLAASARIRGHMDDVRRDLGALASACQRLQNEVLASPAT